MGQEVYSKERISKLNRKDFMRFLGVDKATFSLMCMAVEYAYKKTQK